MLTFFVTFPLYTGTDYWGHMCLKLYGLSDGGKNSLTSMVLSTPMFYSQIRNIPVKPLHLTVCKIGEIHRSVVDGPLTDAVHLISIFFLILHVLEQLQLQNSAEL